MLCCFMIRPKINSRTGDSFEKIDLLLMSEISLSIDNVRISMEKMKKIEEVFKDYGFSEFEKSQENLSVWLKSSMQYKEKRLYIDIISSRLNSEIFKVMLAIEDKNCNLDFRWDCSLKDENDILNLVSDVMFRVRNDFFRFRPYRGKDESKKPVYAKINHKIKDSVKEETPVCTSEESLLKTEEKSEINEKENTFDFGDTLYVNYEYNDLYNDLKVLSKDGKYYHQIVLHNGKIKLSVNDDRSYTFSSLASKFLEVDVFSDKESYMLFAFIRKIRDLFPDIKDENCNNFLNSLFKHKDILNYLNKVKAF